MLKDVAEATDDQADGLVVLVLVCIFLPVYIAPLVRTGAGLYLAARHPEWLDRWEPWLDRWLPSLPNLFWLWLAAVMALGDLWWFAALAAGWAATSLGLEFWRRRCPLVPGMHARLFADGAGVGLQRFIGRSITFAARVLLLCLLLGLVVFPEIGLLYCLVFFAATGLLVAPVIAAHDAYEMGYIPEAPCLAEERLLKQGPASHWCSSGWAGGWLYLTDQRFLFRSNDITIPNYEWSMPLEQVQAAEACTIFPVWKAFLFVQMPDGLRITTANGPDRFRVEDRHGWVRATAQAQGVRGQRSP